MQIPFHFFMQNVVTLIVSSLIVLGAGSLFVVSSMILQMFSMGLRSGEFAGQPSKLYSLANSFDTTGAFEV